MAIPDNKIMDQVIYLIMHRKREIKLYNNEIPRIYYIGGGKSGSTSIMYSFYENSVAHWHDLKYFEKIYNCNLLSTHGYDLYDLIIYIGKKHSFIPTIIESIREPISKQISKIFQHIRFDRD